MQAGQNRHACVIEQQTTGSADEFGHPTEDGWETYRQWWARFEPTTSREFYRASQVQSDMTALIAGRYVPSVTSEMRVRFGTRKFNILGVINVEERGKELQLVCKETT